MLENIKGKEEASCETVRNDASPPTASEPISGFKERRVRGRVGLSVYRKFFGEPGTVARRVWLAVFALVLLDFGINLALQVIMAKLSSGDASLGLFSIFNVVAAAVTIAKLVSIFLATIFVSSSLHREFVHRLSHATKASADTTPSGVFIGISTSEMDTIDSKLPEALEVCSRKGLDLLRLAILGSVATMGLFVPILGVVSFVAFRLARFYAQSSIELSRSQSVARAPVMTMIAEEEQALSVIRSFGVHAKWAAEVRRHAWALASCQIMATAANRWLNIRLSWVGGLGTWLMSFVIVGIARLNLLPVSFIALGLAYCLQLRQILNVLIQASVRVENGMQAVERTRLDGAIEQEDLDVGEPLHFSGGERGVHVEFSSVCARYQIGQPEVLHDVTFEVMPGEKLAVCGRTGAGKSSLTRVLLRLVPLSGGTIRIDGQDIETVSLRSLRSNVGSIAQNGVGVGLMVRETVDPEDKLTDESVYEFLTMVGLPDMNIQALNSELSAGQLQLCSVARGLARAGQGGGGLLLLDEASSSVDAVSEQRLSHLLHSGALQSTSVLIIAHRAQTLLACTRIVVMAEGRVVETGTPDELLRPGTLFQELVAGDK